MADIKIRACCPDDAADVTEIATQPNVVWGTLQLPAQSVSDWRQRLQSNDPATRYQLVAEIDGKVVGLAGLHWSNRMRTRHVADLGMFVHDAYQGQGVGKALMENLLDAADRWLGLVRVELEVYADNERAIKLYRDFGFEMEGVKRMNAYRDGRYVNSVVMGRIRPTLEHSPN
ncbi:MAG TPA: GNAT family N-acetyltransferase [Symbiobacteriaceae bacterium]|nr:GNAT family N-acetyltransferase [Symbiobacteriaceae bacterium]